jgi:hypothetical protein
VPVSSEDMLEKILQLEQMVTRLEIHDSDVQRLGWLPRSLVRLSLVQCKLIDLSGAPELYELKLTNCSGFRGSQRLTSESLTRLEYSDCKGIVAFEELPENLEELDLSCSDIERLPSERPPALWRLLTRNCNRLTLPDWASKVRVFVPPQMHWEEQNHWGE